MPTFEEAQRCPECKEPGDDRIEQTLAIGSGKMHFIYCVNERCEWFNTAWMVQVLPDGTIPERPKDSRYPGDFAGKIMSPSQTAMGRRYIEDLLGRDLRGTEIDKGSN